MCQVLRCISLNLNPTLDLKSEPDPEPDFEPDFEPDSGPELDQNPTLNGEP